MVGYPHHPLEAERLADLHDTELLDTESEEDFDELVHLAAAICNVPMTLVSMIDANRQWFKSRVGLNVSETPREQAFCAHAILQNDIFTVPDALEDERFADNPLVTGNPNIRFYAGVPLASAAGHNLGTLCVIDSQPRRLSPEQESALKLLARQVVAQIEMRRKARKLEREITEKMRYQNELIMANDRLQELATTDALTRLKNRRALREAMEREIEEARRYNRPLSLLMMDVDNFKKVNDTYGHLTGDEVLRGIALILASAVRSCDLPARYGGEEFAVLMPSTTSEEALALGERICKAVAASEIANLRPTVSIGAATFTNRMFDSGELVGAADEALYKAKRAGKNCVICS